MPRHIGVWCCQMAVVAAVTDLFFVSAAPVPRQFDSSMWFWGCYSGQCDVVSNSTWSKIANNQIATNLFPGFGHAMHPGGVVGVAGDAASQRVAQFVKKAHSINVTVQPLIEYWDPTSAAFKTFVRNATMQAQFIDMFVADALKYGYDGYNFDWEFGNFTAADSALGAKFVSAFAQALAAHGKQVSTCQGAMMHSNTDLVDEPNYRSYSMKTYSNSLEVFLQELAVGASKLISRGHSDKQHFGVGFSASSQSWSDGPPTTAELRERFCALRASGVYYISLYSEQYLDVYQPFMTEFVTNKGEACPLMK